jgi:hypothetical protein
MERINTSNIYIRRLEFACGFCGGQSGTGAGFSPSSSVFLHQYISTMAFHTHTSSEWLQFRDILSLHRHIQQQQQQALHYLKKVISLLLIWALLIKRIGK